MASVFKSFAQSERWEEELGKVEEDEVKNSRKEMFRNDIMVVRNTANVEIQSWISGVKGSANSGMNGYGGRSLYTIFGHPGCEKLMFYPYKERIERRKEDKNEIRKVIRVEKQFSRDSSACHMEIKYGTYCKKIVSR